ncbi:hypothetical protein HX744_23420 [Pseudonocardia sp. ICBG1122]|nr:hypothetical protein [Pseudonocardia pini]
MPSTLSLAALAATGLLLVGGGAACASPAEVAVTPAAQSAAERIAVERTGGGQVVTVEFDRADDGRDDDRDDS